MLIPEMAKRPPASDENLIPLINVVFLLLIFLWWLGKFSVRIRRKLIRLIPLVSKFCRKKYCQVAGHRKRHFISQWKVNRNAGS